ncbi:MAG: 16S rRNA (adenine(1518)-N(6)/adenine(1519)-N(6))-dimethyltransferase RsmA [Gemmataceae bacterium]
MAPTTRQTLSYLRTLFQERGILPKNKLGQNFLIDLNLLDLVVRTAELGPADLALEVGSGTGSLTMRLLESAGAVVAVELDPPFASLTREAVESHYTLFAAARPAGTPRDNVRLLHGDVLRGKNTLNDEVVAALRELLGRPGVSHLKLVANLPYAVSVPVLTNLLLTDLPIERMVGMVQWEIAERLMASPGTKDYGALAVLVQSVADVTLVRKLPPEAFWPRPQVDSAIVMVRPNAEKRAKVGDVAGFRNFLRDLYVHRRKNLRGALASLPSGKRAKAEVDAKLDQLGLDGAARAETLDLEQHRRLAVAFA